MVVTLATYQERLPITPGQNIISLDEATKASKHIDSESILKNYIPDNDILQVALQTAIKISPMVRQSNKYFKQLYWTTEISQIYI